MPAWLRAGLFWLHLVTGVLVSLAVTPMAVTGTMMAFEREITAWVESDIKVTDPGTPPLPPSQLLARAAPELPANAKPGTLQLHHDRTAPALLQAAGRVFWVNPYDGHVLGVSRVRQVFATIEDVHRSAGLVFAGARGPGTTLAGVVAIGMLLLSLSGPWLWWPRRANRRQLRRRVWFSRPPTSAARDFTWHHVIGIWCTPIILAASFTGILLGFDGARDVVTAVLGKSAKPQLKLGADAAVQQAVALAPEWSALRLRWNDKGSVMMRVQLGRGVQPTQFAMLDTSRPDAAGQTHTILRRYADGRAGDKFLGWARWLHTGQALGRGGQLLWGSAAVGILVLVWTGMALVLRRIRRARGSRAPVNSTYS